jgi:hypothetical protein
LIREKAVGERANQRDPLREAQRDFRPAFFADRRVAEALRALRVGFAVAIFLEALRALFVLVFGFVDRFFVVELFFFGDADAAFAFRVALVVRFLAAPIAAPERAPIAVPTTGMPSAVPATAPATAPPRVLPAVPVPVSAAPLSLSLSSMFLSH